MLGSLNTRKNWEWCANGKHPASRDYFKIATQHPLLNAFIEWMEKGYNQLKNKPGSGHTLCSWRFWSKGSPPDTLVCGIIRDSSDGVGRPYPLLVMGTGPVTKWRSHPELLPFALEQTWKQMESLAAGRFSDLQLLKEAVFHLPPPEINRYSDTNAPYPGEDINRLLPSEKVVSLQEQLFLEIKGATIENPLNLAMAWSLRLKKQAVGLPSAFLMGGIPEKSYLAFFFRPLGVTDFIHLWSMGSENNRSSLQNA